MVERQKKRQLVMPPVNSGNNDLPKPPPLPHKTQRIHGHMAVFRAFLVSGVGSQEHLNLGQPGIEL